MQKIDHQLLKEGRDGAGLELEEEGLARAQKEEQKATLLPRSRLLSPHGLFTSLLYPYANIHYYSGLHSVDTYHLIRSQCPSPILKHLVDSVVSLAQLVSPSVELPAKLVFSVY